VMAKTPNFIFIGSMAILLATTLKTLSNRLLTLEVVILLAASFKVLGLRPLTTQD